MNKENTTETLNFATRMKELREEKNLGKMELSKALNLNISSIIEYERDRIPNQENLKIIKDFYNVTYDYLFGVSNIKNSDTKNISINKETGLSETSINYLRNLDNDKDKHLIALVNDFIENLDRYNIK